MFLLNLIFIHFIALVTPGPDFMFVSQQSMKKNNILWSVLGVTSGVIIWSLIAILGLSIFLDKFPFVMEILKLLGGCYLIYLGFLILKSLKTIDNENIKVLSDTLSRTRKQVFFTGLLTNLSNPKTLVYFGSVFSILIPYDSSLTLKILAFLLVSIETFLWFLLVSLIFSREYLSKKYIRYRKKIEFIVSLIFIVFGITFIGSTVLDYFP